MTANVIDLDAARREVEQPEGMPLIFKGEDFLLPAELPVDVFDPFLSDEFDLTGLIRDAMAKYKASGEGDGKPSIATAVTDTLFGRPSLPIEIAKAIFGAFEALFGAEDYARFKALRPSLGDYQRLTSALFKAYGASLGEAFASPDSSASDGATQKETSESIASSTSEVSGDAPVSEGGSSE
jgi:hypothetical protein